MEVAIIGAGNMARGIGTRLVSGKNKLTIYDRDENKAKSLADDLSTNDNRVGAVVLGEEISANVIIFALPYPAIFEVAKNYSQIFAGKIVVDISNPVNFETFELIPPPGTSGAEEVQKVIPEDAKLVKAFNTTFSKTLIEGKVADKKLDVLIASDYEDAAKTISKLVESSGLRGIYVGPLARARYLEGIQVIQMSIQDELGSNWMSALKFLP